MLKPEQVPMEVFDAFQKAWSHQSTLSTRECLAIAINAWPGMFGTELEDYTGVYRKIVLPLPREKQDD